MKAGVAISPDTPSVDITDELATAADMLLVMTVYPGTFFIRVSIGFPFSRRLTHLHTE